jgi:hypothetical protein
MLRRLFATDESAAMSLPRIVLGGVFFAHGAHEDAGLVRRARILGNDGPFYGLLAHSRTVRLPRDGRRIL